MTGISTLGAALDQIERIKNQQASFSSLSTQLTSGKKSQTFSGLGVDSLLSTRARADTKSIDTYVDNINNANRRIAVTNNAVNEFKAQAKTFADLLTGLSQSSTHQKGDIVTYDDPLTPETEATAVGQTSGASDADLQTLKTLATKIFDTLTNLLNTKDGDRYVFGGAETANKPFDNNGTLDTALSGLVNGWKSGTVSTDNFIADLQDRTTTGGNANALTDSVVGYSSALSSGNAGSVFVRTSQSNELDYTTLANDKAFRDIITAAAYIKNQNSTPIADVYTPPNAYPSVPDQKGAPGATLEDQKTNFYKVFNSLTASVSNAIKDIDQISYKLTAVQASIQQTKSNYTEEKNLLTNTISQAEDADATEVSVKLTALQTQLQASFQVTSITQKLTLSNYLDF